MTDLGTLGTDDLSYNFAHELRVPLLRIARLAELHQNDDKLDYVSVETIADSALKLLDGFLLSARLKNQQIDLALEPVSISATMYDVAHYLDKLAKAQNCELRLRVQRKSGLVLAQANGVKAALLSLCYGFLHATDPLHKSIITMDAHKQHNVVLAGLTSFDVRLDKSVMNRAKPIAGSAYQSIKDLPTSGAGFFIAANLFDAMTVPLKIIQSSRQFGMMGVFQPSKQLRLL